MMTMEQFDKLPLGQVFATGVLPNDEDGLYMTDTRKGDNLLWVAKKGWGHDWAIYCHWEEKGVAFVTEQGDKVTRENNIKRCVPCSDDLFNIYRY